jgi:hypothetical protein
MESKNRKPLVSAFSANQCEIKTKFTVTKNKLHNLISVLQSIENMSSDTDIVTITIDTNADTISTEYSMKGID